MNVNELICSFHVPNNIQETIRMYSHPTLNINQKKELENKAQRKNKKQQLIEKEIREQTGSICICNVSYIWCSHCYGEFDLFD